MYEKNIYKLIDYKTLKVSLRSQDLYIYCRIGIARW